MQTFNNNNNSCDKMQVEQEPLKRRRGRPRIYSYEELRLLQITRKNRRRGRPRKHPFGPKNKPRPRGRPRIHPFGPKNRPRPRGRPRKTPITPRIPEIPLDLPENPLEHELFHNSALMGSRRPIEPRRSYFEDPDYDDDFEMDSEFLISPEEEKELELEKIHRRPQEIRPEPGLSFERPRGPQRRRRRIPRTLRRFPELYIDVGYGFKAIQAYQSRQLTSGITRVDNQFTLDRPFPLIDIEQKEAFDRIMRNMAEPYTTIIERNPTQIIIHGYLVVSDDLHEMRTISIPYTRGTIQELIRSLWDRQLYMKVREYQDFWVQSITFSSAIAPEFVMGNTGRTIQQANKSWYIYNPKSVYNCVFQAIITIRNYENNLDYLDPNNPKMQKKRVEKAKNLKRSVKTCNDIPDDYADIETLQAVSNYIRRPIKLYNNVFQLIKSFEPEKPLKRIRKLTRCYELQKVGDHCLALIRKRDILKKDPNYVFPEPKKELEREKQQECQIIKKSKNFDKEPNKLATWDIEAYPNGINKFTAYAVGFCVRDQEGEQFERQWWGLNCLNRFAEWLSKNMKKLNGYTLYAHNGGKFDLPLMMEEAFTSNKNLKIDGKKCTELNNSWISFQIRSKKNRKHHIIFRDSSKMLPGKLEKLCKDFKVEHQKLTETVNHNEINAKTWRKHQTTIGKYLEHDTKGLLEVMESFSKSVWKELKIDITKCYTGASLSKATFFKNYYDPKKYPIYTLSDEYDEYVRKGYYGGRVECFRLGKVPGDSFHYDDFTSEYPDVGRKLLPYGKPEKYTFIDKDNGLFGRLPMDLIHMIEGFVDDGTKIFGNRKLPSFTDKDPKKNIHDLLELHGKQWTDRKKLGNICRWEIPHNKEICDKDHLKLDDLLPGTDLVLDTQTKSIKEQCYICKEKAQIWHNFGTERKETSETFFGFVNAMVRHKPEAIKRIMDKKDLPKHCRIINNRLVFPIVKNWTRFDGLFTETLDFKNYEYRFIDGLRFKSGNFMAKFFNDGFSKKATAKKNGQLALAQANKIIINSGYGFWGLRTKERDGVMIAEKGDQKVLEYLKMGKLMNIRDNGEYTFARVLKDLETKKFNVSIASAITEYAREKTYSFMKDVMESGEQVYYCDTDSCISSLNMEKYPKIKKKFKFDGTGDALGSMKNEADDLIKKKLGKDVLKDLNKREGNNIHFDKLIITGCKQYSLQKDVDGQLLEITKIKGYSKAYGKLSYDLMEKMTHGEKLSQDCYQFRCPRSNYVSETTPFHITHQKVTKSFRQVYNKGIVHTDGIITPLII